MNTKAITAARFPICLAAAKSVEGVRRLISKAIRMHVEHMQQAGEKVPMPRPKAHLTLEETQDVAFCTWVDLDVRRPVSS
jgi:predicted RNase H-like HicB family nuclease